MTETRSNTRAINADPAFASNDGSGRRLLAPLGLVLLMLTAGCPGNSSTPASGEATAKSKQQENEDRCAEIIASIRDTFDLQRLGQTTAISDGVMRINDWQLSCAPAVENSSELPKPLQGLLSPDERKEMESLRFTFRDGEHLRDCVLFRSLAGYAAGGSSADASELQRVTAVFDHIIRGIELTADHPDNLPLTAYEVYLIGRGTAADRAWIFSEILRQLKIDSVLLAPGSSETAKAELPQTFLVGVLLDGKTYLFDPRLGVPVPGSDDAGAAKVATLEEAASDPAVLKRLDAGTEYPYPLSSAQLQQPRVLLMGDTTFWSSRMRGLQDQFTGEHSMVLGDLLQDRGETPGAWSRIAKAGGERWSGDSLRIWSYPENQLETRAELPKEGQERLATLFSPFEAYLTLRRSTKTGKPMLVSKEELSDPSATQYDPGVRQRLRTTTGVQMRARLAHLAGDFAPAIGGYAEVRQQSRKLLEMAGDAAGQRERQLHERAIDDAQFWMALCKFEQGDYRVTVDTLERYRTQHPDGAWTRQARYLLAISLAAQEEFAAAIAELAEVEPDDPEYAGYQWRIRQWQSRVKPADEAKTES
jgi:hypothetical protein